MLIAGDVATGQGKYRRAIDVSHAEKVLSFSRMFEVLDFVLLQTANEKDQFYFIITVKTLRNPK